MKQRKLGTQGLSVSEIGFGGMSIAGSYGASDEAEALKVLDRALELGVNFWDTADIYGPYTGEQLIGKAAKGRRDRLVIATKFGIVRDASGARVGINGTPAYVREACDASLKRLGVDCIDLYYQHRVDPDTPIEETVGAMAELVKAGKVRYLGLSEASARTIRRANAVHPISALQTEYSLWSRDPEDGILDVTRELGIGFVAYSPLGRGFLTGAITSPEDFGPGDLRRSHPRFIGENFAKNLQLVERVKAMAEARGVTPGQIALAWVLAQGQDIVPIPGTKHLEYLEQNVAAAEIALSSDDLRELEALSPKGAVAGERNIDMAAIDR